MHVPYDYSKAINAARLQLDEAELKVVKHPEDIAAKEVLNSTLQKYRTTLANPLGPC